MPLRISRKKTDHSGCKSPAPKKMMLCVHIHVIGLMSRIHANAGMETRLWNYIATFSNMTGSRLSEIYKKLKEAAPANSSRDGNTKAMAGPSGRENDSNGHEGPNHVLPSHPGAKRYTSLQSLNAEGPYNRDYERERGDSETWQRHRDLDRERDAASWQRRARDERLGVDGGGPPGGMYNMNDRRQWDGRPDSSEGWAERGILGPPGVHVVPGILANGNGWSQDPRQRLYPGVGGGRGPMDRERFRNGNPVFIHQNRGGGRGL
jgi:hypothetical protein